MTSADLLLDAFERIREVFHQVVEDLTPEMLVIQIAPETNSIAWLLWHLTRVQDHHIADAAGPSRSGQRKAGTNGLAFHLRSPPPVMASASSRSRRCEWEQSTF